MVGTLGGGVGRGGKRGGVGKSRGGGREQTTRGRLECPGYCCSGRSDRLPRHLLPPTPSPIVGRSEWKQWEWNPSSPAAWQGWACFLLTPPKGMLSCPGCVAPAGKNGTGAPQGRKALWLELMTIGVGVGREWTWRIFSEFLLGFLCFCSFSWLTMGSLPWSRPLRQIYEQRDEAKQSQPFETG